MKVLQINTFYLFGSTGRIVWDLKTLAEQKGIESFAAYGPEIDNGDKGTLRLQSIPRRKINILRTRLFDHHGFYNEKETERLISWMNEVKPDVIHLHNVHNHYVHVGMLFDFIREHNLPVVWTLHDCWPFTGHCAYFDYADCDKWKTICHDCPSTHEYPPTWFFDKSSRNYKDKKTVFCGVRNLTLVTPSRWLSGLIRESFLSDYPVKVINNGVDLHAFCRQDENVKSRLGVEGKRIILAMATTFDKRKGMQFLKLLPEMLNDDEVLILVGLAKEQLGQFLMPRCIGIGRTNSVEELCAFYSAANVYINPTLEDNFPTTNIEALACGTPVVTFNTGGSVESVLDDESIISDNGITYSSVGAVVPKGDLQAMVDTARHIMVNGKTAYCEACRKKAEMHYDKNKQYMKYIVLYNEIYAKSNNSL
jgi:glycosyltransferase involved in cell wall biosynthesis